MITEDDIKRVRDANDIVELIGERVVLKQRGREFWGNCPFHNEKTPSFKIDPASQFYHCFGCGEGGDVFKYMMKTEGLDFLDAVRSLAQRKSIELKEEQGKSGGGKKARLIAVCDEANAFYHQQLMRVKSSEADAARAYLGKRGLGGSVARDWSLGFAPGRGMLVKHLSSKGFTRDEMIAANVAYSGQGSGRYGAGGAGGLGSAEGGMGRSGAGALKDRFFNRVIFPISDLQGRTIAFGGRVIGSGEPKYLNSSDTRLFHKRENLFAIDKAKAPITTSGAAIVVEGYTDVIAMHRAGFNNTVATLGTALTPEHLKLLSRFTKKVILLFDGDEAGKRAADRAVDLITVMATAEAGQKLDLFVAMLPGSMDPADYLAAEGHEAMQKTLDTSAALLQFALDRRLAHWNLDLPEQRNRALNDVITLLVPVKGSLLAMDYINYLSDVLHIDYALVASALEHAKAPAVPRAADGAARENRLQDEGASEQPRTIDTSGAGDKLLAMESELLFIFIEHPGVRERLVEAFGRITWSTPGLESIARALAESDRQDGPDDLMAKLLAKMPDVSSLLSNA
ncbi:MAG TPA: DNA primase, partial [Coriobacteriia bacterium]|nr:DNA primase [Coriobacteriia bacterium]